MTNASESYAADFINRWKASGGAELANSQPFLKELCALLDVPQPDPTQPDESQNTYVFEKAVEFNNGDGTTSAGRVDLYRRACFVLESKQGAERKAREQAEALATTTRQRRFRTGTAQRGTPTWEQAMVKARQQARRYAEALPGEWPPFLIVADVGYCFDLYADFAQAGKNYIPFPDPLSYRIKLADLANADVHEKLRAIWLDPHALDASRQAAQVTRELADRLAKLAKSLEKQYPADVVAQFLMRCLFTMFAEDVEIGGLKKGHFTHVLEGRRGKLDTFVPMLETLWQTMDAGGFSVILEGQLKQFNGGLFEDHTALPLNDDQLELLIEAAQAQWKDVEPAIFGTLLERALSTTDRHKLGAHFTPRAYVERLVMPTIMEPLREEWDTVYATAVALDEAGKTKDAVAAIRAFHEHLCNVRILDPACGSGNFLYVSLELMKRLEGEVLNALREFRDEERPILTIDPHQFLGIEVNPRAAAITDLVLWIGYLQWHFRTRGNAPLHEPIIRKFHNIECRDAVLAWDAIEPVVDEDGTPVTRWDGRTTKTHPVTGEEVPDETARVQELRYINPRKAEWPQADYIVGNPPFIVKHKMIRFLGVGYVHALRDAFSGTVPDSADYVMYWWYSGAAQTGAGTCTRFGFITTNSITQIFNRRVVRAALTGKSAISMRYATPDHPWVQSETGAAVRIAMTVGERGCTDGVLDTVHSEIEREGHDASEVTFRRALGRINSKLGVGIDFDSAVSLRSNCNLSSNGMMLGGRGFLVTLPEIDAPFGILRPIRNGNDILQRSRNAQVIDFYDHNEEEARAASPSAFQQVIDLVKPLRDANRRASRRRKWWLFSETMPQQRAMVAGLSRYIAVPETGVHRLFVFLPALVVPEHPLICIALENPYFLGILSSRVHVVWSLEAGGTLEDRPRYNKSVCFETFPFPCDGISRATSARIGSLAEQLDAHRKRQQELHPELTMTGMYNVLEKLRSGAELTTKEKTIHEQGLVSVLKQIHDDLDAAVFDAYGWPRNLSDEEILQRLVALNHERAEEEKRGLIRWLRPEFQNPQGAERKTQQPLVAEPDEEVTEPATALAAVTKQPWPKSLPERITAVRGALVDYAAPADAVDIAKRFSRARKETVEELLETLVTVGQIRLTDDGRYVA